MLSILIPCYNYNCYNLVEHLHDQCETLDIPFEILVSEDGGHTFAEENSKINGFTFSTYVSNKLNIGRAGNINRLLNSAQYSSKLILDCDLKPKDNQFLANYLPLIMDANPVVCFGGILYEESNKTDNLRYNYGIKREATLAVQRSATPYKSLLTSNLLIVNCSPHFDDRISTYGYEDLVFAQSLKGLSIPVKHIDNQLLHLNVEENSIYFQKMEIALHTLISLEHKGTITKGLTRISSIRLKFAKFHSTFMLGLIYLFCARLFKSIILSKGAPLWLFDTYKLLYFNKHY